MDSLLIDRSFIPTTKEKQFNSITELTLFTESILYDRYSPYDIIDCNLNSLTVYYIRTD